MCLFSAEAEGYYKQYPQTKKPLLDPHESQKENIWKY